MKTDAAERIYEWMKANAWRKRLMEG